MVWDTTAEEDALNEKAEAEEKLDKAQDFLRRIAYAVNRKRRPPLGLRVAIRDVHTIIGEWKEWMEYLKIKEGKR